MKRALFLVPAVFALLAVQPAGASCMGPPPGFSDQTVDASKVAFVGTVVRFGNGDSRWAIVRVDEVLKGKALANEVEVWGSIGRPQPNAFSSIDRTYVLGGTYRFAFEDDRSPFEDNSCSATEMIALVEVPEPAQPSSADRPQEQSSDIPWPAMGAGVAAILAGLVALGLLDRRMNRGSNSSANV